MSSDTLAQHLRTLHRFAKSWSPHDSRFGAIAQDLEAKRALLKSGKPLMRCVSRHLQSAQRLKALLDADAALAQTCHIAAVALPFDGAEMTLPRASLILQNRASSQRSTSLDVADACTFSLVGKNPWMLGRHPDCSVQLPDRYSLVSGRHASIQFEPNVDPHHQKAGQWRIYDTSRNGTYVNGQHVQDSHPLAMGDRITLGFPNPTATAPLLLFDDEYDVAIAQTLKASPVLGCEVLWFIIQGQTPITPSERAFFARLIQSQIPVKMIALDIHPSASQESHSMPPELISLAESVAPHCLSTLNCIPVSLSAPQDKTSDHLHLDTPAATFDALKTCLEQLGALLNTDSKPLISYRLKADTLAQVDNLSRLLSLQKTALSSHQVSDFNDPTRDAIAQLRNDIDQVLKTIEKDHKLFFDQVRDRLKPVKQELMNDHLQDSISSKIRRFADQLKPVVSKRNRKRILQLRYTPPRETVLASSVQAQGCAEYGLDANTALLQFCQNELGRWVDQEWTDICQVQGDGGIQGLATRLFDALAAIPHVHLTPCSPTSYQPRWAIAYEDVFNENFTRPDDEMPFREPSPLSYTLKKIRSQWMQFIFLFSFISIMGIAGRRQIMRYISTPIIAAFNAHPWLSSALLTVLAYWGVRSLKQIYQDDRQDERENAAQKIRSKLCNHYQSLVRTRLLDRLIKILEAEIEIEKNRLESVLQTIRQHANEAIQQFEADLQANAPSTDDNQRRLNVLETDQTKLEALKTKLLPR